MSRDSQEELNRLTKELLAEETIPEAEEDILNDALIKSLMEETDEEETTAPTEVAEEKEPKDPVVTVLTVIALLLMTGIFGVLIWWLIQIHSLF